MAIFHMHHSTPTGGKFPGKLTDSGSCEKVPGLVLRNGPANIAFSSRPGKPAKKKGFHIMARRMVFFRRQARWTGR